MTDFDLDDFNKRFRPKLNPTSDTSPQVPDESDESKSDTNKSQSSKKMADLNPQQRAALWAAGRLNVDAYNASKGHLNINTYNANEGQRHSKEWSDEQLKERWASDWESFKKIGLSDEKALSKIRRLEELLQESMERNITYSPAVRNITYPPARKTIYKGPRGGKYRINKNGRKSYDVP